MVGVACETWDILDPGYLQVLDAQTGKQVWKRPCYPATDQAIVFDHEGKHLAVAEKQGLAVLNARTGEDLFRGSAEDGRFSEMLFCPRTGYLVLGGKLRSNVRQPGPPSGLRVWDWKEKRLHMSLGNKLGATRQLEVVAPGGWLSVRVLGDVRGQEALEIWDLVTKNLQTRFPGENRKTRLSNHGSVRYVPELNCVLWRDHSYSGPWLQELDTGLQKTLIWLDRESVHQWQLFPDGKQVLLSMSNGNLLVCHLLMLRDLEAEWRGNGCNAPWQHLGPEDKYELVTALRLLGSRSEELLGFARRELRPEPARPEKEIARAIRDLDADDAVARKQAQEELRKWGRLALPELAAAAKSTSAEVRRSARTLLQNATHGSHSAAELRDLRVMRLLTYGRVPGGRELLQTMAKGEPLSCRTTEAQRLLRCWETTSKR